MDKVYTESYILDFRTSKQQELLKNYQLKKSMKIMDFTSVISLWFPLPDVFSFLPENGCVETVSVGV